MDTEKVKQILKKLSSEIEGLKKCSRQDPRFKAWEEKVFRRIITIYGEGSREYYGFKGINFHLHLGHSREISQNRENAHMQRCLEEATYYFESLIEELELLPKASFSDQDTHDKVTKIFISHSTNDKYFVGEIIDLLSIIGIKDDDIFCTSFEGHSIPLGENFLEVIKEEVSGNILVFFVLSKNYYKSLMSLCEMGAAWALSKKHVPILIPPFDYKDMKGPLPQSQAIKINDPTRWTTLKSQLERLFELTPKTPEIWEDRRNKILSRIQEKLDNP